MKIISRNFNKFSKPDEIRCQLPYKERGNEDSRVN